MSEGQHIEEFLEKYENFFNKKRCAAVVQEARATYKKPDTPATNQTKGPTLFAGPVENYNTIAKLNTYIGEISKGPETETKIAGPVSDTIAGLCKDKELDEFKQTVCSWTRMVSSGSEFDCLIHSFLTMVSPNFRRLSGDQKDPIASAFRRTLFLKFPAVERAANSETVKQQIPASGVFLTDSELQILSLTYKINIIVFEQEKSERVGKKQHTMPATITPLDNFESTDTFYLLSNRNSHYEAVKTKDSYTVNRDTMNMILAEFPQEFTGEAKPVCKYPGTDRDIEEGDIVIYKGTPYMVVEKRYSGSPPKCKTLKAQNMKRMKYLKYPHEALDPITHQAELVAEQGAPDPLEE